MSTNGGSLPTLGDTHLIDPETGRVTVIPRDTPTPPIAPCAEAGYVIPMPKDMHTWAMRRVSSQHFTDLAEYVRNLIRQDLQKMDNVIFPMRTHPPT